MSLSDEIKAFEDTLRADAGHLVDGFKSLVAKLLGEAETDAADVAHEAAPVVEAAKADVEQLASDAVSGAEAVVSESGKSSA